MTSERICAVAAGTLVALVLGMVPAGASAPPAAPGDPEALEQWRLDESFGTDGFAIFDPPSGRGLSGGSIAMLPDGRAVVGTQMPSGDFGLIRLMPDGELDPTFGDDGFAVDSAMDPSASIALQQVGTEMKIVALRGGPGHVVHLARYNADGSLDTAHDADPEIEFGAGGHKTYRLQGARLPYGVEFKVVEDGSIVFGSPGYDRGGSSPVLVRLLRDGNFDPVFGDRGRVILPFRGGFNEATLVTVDGQPRHIAVGWRARNDRNRWLVAAFLPTGEIDESFGVGGFARLRPPKDPPIPGADAWCERQSGSVRNIHVMPSGDLALAGRSCTVESEGVDHSVHTYARISPTGEQDRTYSGDGWAYPIEPSRPDPDPDLQYTAIGPDGTVFWAGQDSYFEGTTDRVYAGGVQVDGVVDPGFGPDNFLAIDLPDEGLNKPFHNFSHLATDTQGRLLLTVTTWTARGGRDPRLCVLRLTNQAA